MSEIKYLDPEQANSIPSIKQQFRFVKKALEDGQTIPDIDQIRANAAKGATAYQKPSGGIPASDLNSTVRNALSKAEGAVSVPGEPGTVGQVLQLDAQGNPAWVTPSAGTTPDSEISTSSTNAVQNKVISEELLLGAVYDVSAKNPTAGSNNDGKFESLSALLSDANLNTLIPIAVRKGGMSIKFVLSSDNKYVQFRYMGTSTATADFTNVANWQGVDETPTAGSQNLVTSGGAAEYVKVEQNITTGKALATISLGSEEKSVFGASVWDTILNKDVVVFSKSVYAESYGDLFTINNLGIPEGAKLKLHFAGFNEVFEKIRIYYNGSSSYTQYETADVDLTAESAINSMMLRITGTWFIAPGDVSFSIECEGKNPELIQEIKVVEDSEENQSIYVGQTPLIAIDKLPTLNSKNLAESGGVFNVVDLLYKLFNVGENKAEFATFYDNHVINMYGAVVEVQNKGYTYSSPIQVSRGDTVIIINKNKIPSGYAAYCETDAEGTVYYNIHRGEDAATLIYQFSVQQDGYITLCSRGNLDEKDRGCYVIPSDFAAIVNAIAANFLNYKERTSELTWQDGVRDGSDVNSSTTFQTSSVIHAYAGDIIEYNASANIGFYYNIIRINEDGTYGVNLFRQELTTPSYRYCVRQECYLAFNKRKNQSVLRYFSSGLSDLVNSIDSAGSLFPSNKYLPLFSNANKETKQGNTAFEPIVTLLHFSDIHGTKVNIERILHFMNKYSDNITDTISTGDICPSKYFDYDTRYDANPTYKKILQVIGNHDVYDHNGDFDGTATGYNDPAYYATAVEKYNRYIKPFVSEWNVTQPDDAEQNGYCYYYKDYADSKIRLIVLDAYGYDMIDNTPSYSVQLSWLESVLLDARNNNKAVLIADHYKPTSGAADVNGFDTPFHSLTDFMSPDHTYRLSWAINAVDNFIDDGGDFICWLAGHTHYDQVATITSHPNQIFIVVGSASRTTTWQDSKRLVNFDSEDLFNIISFDYKMKIIKVFRVGGEVDQYMRHRGGFTLKWDTKELLSTW